MPGEMSFCTITPEMGDRTASSVPMRCALLLRLIDFLRGDAEDAQRLQAVLNVGGGVVVVRHAAFVILDGHHPVVQHFLHAVDDALVELLAVAGLAVRRDGVGHIGTGDVEQRLVLLDGRANIHQNPRDRPVHLGDGLGGVVLVPIHRAGGVDRHSPGGLRHLRYFQMGQLILWHGEKAGLHARLGRGFAFVLFRLSTGQLGQPQRRQEGRGGTCGKWDSPHASRQRCCLHGDTLLLF
jgi:hypothetical protein